MLRRSPGSGPVRWGLLWLLLAILACTQSQAPATVPAFTPRPTATTTTVPIQAEPRPVATATTGPLFAPYTPSLFTADVTAPRYRVELEQLINPDLLADLTPAQQEQLTAQGFLMVPATERQLYEIYQKATEKGHPVFVSSDLILHTTQVLIDYTIQQTEAEYLMADLQALNQTMRTHFERQVETTLATQSPEVAPLDDPLFNAYWHNLAYFGVGSRLLAADTPLPVVVDEAVSNEMTLINRGTDTLLSPIFGQPIDYTAFSPTDHYATAGYAPYFKTLHWYSLPLFPLAQQQPASMRQAARQLLLLLEALESTQNFTRWQRIYESSRFFQGSIPHLTITDYTTIAESVYGHLPTAAELEDPVLLDSFIITARTAAGAAEIPFTFFAPRPPAADPTLAPFVFNQVGPYLAPTLSGQPLPVTALETEIGVIRAFPHELDLAAAWGSPAAYAIIAAGGDTQYEGYESQLAAAGAEYQSLDPFWTTTSIAQSWLYSLQPLLDTPAVAAPLFMRHEHWAQRQLLSWTGAWVEGKHDLTLTPQATIYTPPTELGLIDITLRPKGYVEPQPQLFGRLAALIQQLQTGLTERGIMNPDMAGRLQSWHGVLINLQSMAAKELQDIPLTKSEFERLRQIGTDLERLTAFPHQDLNNPFLADTHLATLIPLHSDPHSGLMLQAGIGEAWLIYVVVPIQGELTLTVGGVYSLYIFKQPLSEPISEAAWRILSPRPETAAWVQRLIGAAEDR